jgi:hypothetical protein
MPLVGVTAALYDMHLDSNSGCSWLVGAADTVLYSCDGWVTWDYQRVCEQPVVHDVFGVAGDGHLGWLVGSSELVCYTRDAGLSWHLQTADHRHTSRSLRGIAVLGSGAYETAALARLTLIQQRLFIRSMDRKAVISAMVMRAVRPSADMLAGSLSVYR